MSSHRGDFLDCKVYVGGLPADTTSQELEDAFHRYGRIRKVWVARRPPGFAFVEFEDNRDAEDAVRALDGNRICGVRARVELSHGRRRNQDGGGGGGGGGYRGGRGGGGYRGGGDRGGGGGRRDSRSRSRSPPPRRGGGGGGGGGGRSRSRSPRGSPRYDAPKNGRGGASRSPSPRRSVSRSPPPRRGGRSPSGSISPKD